MSVSTNEVDEPVITFDDYEKLMKRLEKEKNFQAIEQANPKALAYQNRKQQEDINRRMIAEQF